MLKDFVKASKPDEEEFARRLEEERAKLFAAQMKIKEAGLPVMVIFEGWALQERAAFSERSLRTSIRDSSG